MPSDLDLEPYWKELRSPAVPKLKARDHARRRVRLTRDLVTNGGSKFFKGEVMIIYGTWRGRFHMESELRPPKEIRQVSKSAFKLILGPRVVFLDIDGVLNNTEFFKRRGHEKDLHGPDMLDPENMEILNEILKKTGAVVVLSASSRHYKPLDEIASVFKQRGFDGIIHDRTPELWDEGRGKEIQTWLDANPCSAYVVLDDDVADMAHMRCRQVKTSIHEGGLQDYHVKQVCDLLGVR